MMEGYKMSMMRMLPAVEMGFFNLLTVHYCSHKKYSNTITAVALCLVTLFFLALISVFNLPFTGNGKYSLGGLLYLIPLKYLYREKFSRLFVIVCMSWVYTMSVVSVCVQIAGMINPVQSTWLLLILETVIFLATMVPFYRRIVPKYIFIFQNIESFGKRECQYLAVNGYLSFLMLACLHTQFSLEGSSLFRLFIVLLVITFIVISYYIIYRIVLDSAKMRQLEHAVYHDALTGLGNRAQLWNDMEALCGTEDIFSVVFMDLDRFKQVNDRYGHLAGDQYLKHFAEICARIFQDTGRVYRFGGDEFAALYYGILPEEKLEQIRECPGWEEGAPCPFNQVSAGILICRPPHGNAEEILRNVDRAMYQNKINKVAGGNEDEISYAGKNRFEGQ